MSKLHPHVSLDEIANFANGKALSESKYDKHGLFPVYGSNGIIAYSNKKRYDEGVTVIGRVGAYCGSVYFSNGPAWITDNAIVTTGKNGVNNRFLYYLLKTLQLNRTAIGSAQPLLTQSGLKVIKARVPPIEKRSAIQTILSALDDKIENNKRINETLEEMGRTIFKSWFVDFDPVHAKATGNSPAHMDPKTAALFPSSFGDDGLPVGWQYKKLQDTSDLSWGDLKTTKKSYVETGFDAYSASGKDGKLPHFDFEKLGIVLSAIGANCGYTWLARGKWSCIKNTIRFWSKYDLTPTIFLYHATKGNNFWPIRGSAQPFISQGDARDQKIIVPANGEAISFEKIVGDFYEKISANEHENQTLAKLRNTLLPKLMSGEIRVKDAEREVETAL